MSGGAFRSDGKLFVTSDMGGAIRFADASTGEAVGSAVRHSGVVKSVAFSPDGKTVVVAAQFGVSLQCYDVDSRRPVGPTFECKDNLYAATYSPDGKIVATAAKENNASLWDVATGRRLGQPLLHPGRRLLGVLQPGRQDPRDRLFGRRRPPLGGRVREAGRPGFAPQGNGA